MDTIHRCLGWTMRFLQSFCSCFFVSSDRSSYRDSALVLVQATFQILSLSTNIHSFFFLQIECRVIIIDPGHLFLSISLFFSLFLSISLYFSISLFYLSSSLFFSLLLSFLSLFLSFSLFLSLFSLFFSIFYFFFSPSSLFSLYFLSICVSFSLLFIIYL